MVKTKSKPKLDPETKVIDIPYQMGVELIGTDALERAWMQIPVIQMGLNFMTLGALLTNPDTKIRALSDAASKCGLGLQIKLVPSNAPKPE